MISFSIITCTYNAAQYLDHTLQSVLHQDYPCIEHLIIDGLSKDSTLTIAQQYKEESDASNNFHRIVITSEKDKGLYDAMNKGLLKATGDYLVFLNAGDTLPSPDTIRQIAEGINTSGKLPGVLYGDTDIVDEDRHFLRHRHLSAPEILTSRSFLNGMLICHQAFYALTSIARAIPYNNIEYRFSADVDWCIRIMKQTEAEGRTMHNTHRVIAHFLDGGMTTANHRASLIERFHVMTKHYGLLRTIIQHFHFVFRNI